MTTTTAATSLPPSVPDDLVAFLAAPCDSREYRRALAVKLALQDVPYAQICAVLDVTPGFVSQVKKDYLTDGVAGLRLKYQGGHAFLTPNQHAAVIMWLQAQQHWSLMLLKQHIHTTYQLVYQSDQSYYDLLAEAGIRYKKSQARNPKQDPGQIAAKKTKSAPS